MTMDYPEAVGGTPSLGRRLSGRHKLWILNFVALTWGSTHAVMKAVVMSSASPSTVVAVRFWLASTFVVPWLPCCAAGTRNSRPALRYGLLLGAMFSTSFALYAAALQRTSASRVAFVFYLNVKFVPIFARCFLGRRMSSTAWAMAATAVAGTLLMCNDGSPPNVGDVFALGSAICGATIILLTEYGVKVCSAHELNAVTTVVTMLFSTILAVRDVVFIARGKGGPDLDPVELIMAQVASLYPFWLHMAFLGIFCTAFIGWLQNVGQEGIPAEKASIIFAMDPVYGAIFSRILLGEKLGPLGLLGAALVSAAAMTAARDQIKIEAASGAPDVVLQST